MSTFTSTLDIHRKNVKADPSELSISNVINDAVASLSTTYSSTYIETLISESGSVLSAITYDEAATSGILLCSKYDVNG